MGKNSELFLQQQQESAQRAEEQEQQLRAEKLQYTKGVDALTAQYSRNTSILQESTSCVDRMIEKVRNVTITPSDASVLAIVNPEALD